MRNQHGWQREADHKLWDVHKCGYTEEIMGELLAAARRLAPGDPRVPLLEWSVAHQPGPRQPARLVASAWRAYESLDFASAEKYVTLALAADDRLADAAYIAGLVHSRLHAGASSADEKLRRHQLALAAFQRACELAPDRADCAFALALRLREDNNAAAARPFYERAARLDPGLAAAWLGLGEACLETGDIPAAVAAFSDGLRHAPEHQILQQALAIATEHTVSTAQAFANRLFEIQDARPDCLQTKFDPQWKQWVEARPSIAVVRTIAGQTDALPFGETIRLLLSAGAAAVEAGGSLAHHEHVPTRSALMAYQPWFNFDTRRIVTESFDQGLLTILLDDEVASVPAAPAFTPDNFRTLAHRDITLWSVSTHRICLEIGQSPAAIDAADPSHATVIGTAFTRAIALIDRVLAYVDFYQPATVLMAQGHDQLSAVLRHVAVRRGLRVVAIENIFRSDRLLWDDASGVAVNRNLAKNHYWRHRDLVSENLARRSVAAFFENRTALKSAEHATPAAALPPRPDDGVRTIAYLAQVAVDSSVLFGLRGFASQAEVIATLAAFAARRGHRLLVKLHPKESPHHPDPQGWYQRLTARALDAHPGFQAARAALGDRLVLDADNTHDTCDFIRQADVCVTINSQAGLEAALLDREVILCGDAFYGGLGFTHEATDAPSLEFTLDRVLREGLRLNDGRDASLFFHIFTELYCLPKTVAWVVRLLSGRPDFRPTPAIDPERAQPDLVYDVGMNNGDDTAYYLRLGKRVVAIEADPDLCARARERFAAEITDGRLDIVNMGVGPQAGTLDFWICENKREWNSFHRRIASRDGLPHHAIKIPCQTFEWIVARHGVPGILKIDIEGHDRFCIDALAALPDLPDYVSVEIGDIDAFTRRLEALGYTEFKCISQFDFLPMQLPPSDEQLRRERGEPAPTRRHGDWIFPEGSSGPCGEHTAGRCLSADEARAVYSHYLELSRRGGESPFWYGKNYSFWVDLHARRAPATPAQPQPRASAQLVTA